MLSFREKLNVIESTDEANGTRRWQAALVVEDDRGEHLFEGRRAGVEAAGRAGGWRVCLRLCEQPPFDVVQMEVVPRPRRRLKRVFLRLRGGRHRVPSMASSRTRMLVLPEGTFVEKGVVPLGNGRAPVESGFLTLLHDGESRQALLAGVAGPVSDFSSFRTDGKVLEAGFAPDRELLRRECYALALGVGEDPLGLLADYGGLLHPLGRHRCGPVTGWNSWDYYGASVSMDDIRAEMAAIKASSLADRVTHIVVDMGWWTDWGENIPNRRFPASFRAIAREIKEAGFVPGIWHAPLLASPWSRIGRHRQDLFLQDPAGGAAMVGEQGVLDWSHPEVLEGLQTLFSSLRKAGFRYFKLDYIYPQAVRQPGQRYDATEGPLGIIRRGLRVIREAVGEDSYLLNCGAPPECALGIADASRVSSDIHTFWSHIWHNSREIACHLWEQGNLWNVDPDFAVVRCSRTTNDPFPQYLYRRREWQDRNDFWMAGPEASFDELKVWLTVVHMTGGDVFFSDSMARLNPTGIAALEKLLPRVEESARPLDLFVSPFPRFWLATSQGVPQLAVFNWEDEPRPIVVPEGVTVPSHGKDIWSGRRIRLSESTLMAPRSAYLLVL